VPSIPPAAEELASRDCEDLALAAAGIEPQERQLWELLLQQRSAGSDLDHEDASWRQMVAGYC
jgi:hypothetical protein